MRTLVLLAVLICATAHSDNATLPSVNIYAVKDWHRNLDVQALILPVISVEAETAGDALEQTMEAYGVSINVYLKPANQIDEVFQYRDLNVSLATMLEAIGNHYGLKLERDPDTGVSWLLPEDILLENILPYHVTIDEARAGWPLYSRLLATLERRFTKAALRGEESALAVFLPARGFVGARETGFDIPTQLPAGTYEVVDILHYCNQMSPWLAFRIWDEDEKFPILTVYPVQVSGDNCSEPTPGWTKLWEIAMDGSSPYIDKTLQTMLQSEEYTIFSAHLARKFCRHDRPFLDALNSAETPLQKANVINSYASIRLNAPNASMPAAILHAAEKLLGAGFYEEGPGSIVLPLLLNLAMAQQNQAEVTKLLSDYAEHRSFSASELRGAELQVGKAAYIGEAVWRALMDTDAKSYIDTEGWAATFLPKVFHRLEYQNLLPGQ